jgi:hypothetical protein
MVVLLIRITREISKKKKKTFHLTKQILSTFFLNKSQKAVILFKLESEEKN